uniref:Uncharacterized protein n=1 Tax=Arundo donax TaxID=35708 RepID=A0A0A9B8E2_ARUDO
MHYVGLLLKRNRNGCMQSMAY